MTEKTEDQIAAEVAAKAAAKAAEAEARELAKAEAKAKREAEAAERKAQREAEKAAKKAEREAEREAKRAEREAEKERIKAEREAARMPEQNGVRRPKPETLCGQAWEIFDTLSQQHGQPAAIGDALDISRERGLNDGNVRAEYARWRKFHGITGRVVSPVAKTEEAPAEAEQAAE